MRVCVIGAGIIGSTIAYELSKHSTIETTLIDGSYPGWGATAASFGWINANAKEPKTYFDLNTAGITEYERIAQELGSEHWLHRDGCLVMTPSDEETVLRVDRAKSLGYRADVVSATTVAETLEPSIRVKNPDRMIAYFPGESWIDTQALLGALLYRANGRGLLCHFGRSVVGIEATPTGGYVLRLSDLTSFEVDVVVNAAGAAADQIAAMVSRKLTLAPTLGITMRIRSNGLKLKTIVRSPSVDARPDGHGYFRVHGHSIDQKIATGTQDRNRVAAEFLRRSELLFPEAADAVVVDTRIAPRPMPEDGLPWVGPAGGLTGYFECVTHSGITLGPLLARLLVEEIVTESSSPLLAPYRADRQLAAR